MGEVVHAAPPASARSRRDRLGWVALAPATLGLVFILAGTAVGLTTGSLRLDSWLYTLSGVSFALVATVVLRRHLGHRVGWLLAVVGVLIPAGFAAEQVILAHYVHGHDLAGATAALWFGQWYWLPFLYALFVGVPLLFPTGRPLSPAWGRFGTAALAVCGTVSVTGMFTGRLHLDFGYLEETAAFDNPVGLLPVDDIESEALAPFVIGALFLFAIGALVSLLLRFRRSRGAERQQMKWGVLGLAVTLLGFLSWAVLEAALGYRMPVADSVTNLVAPVALGLAITRYRLWDVDRLIGRTVAYLVVTVVLAGVYVGLVVGAQALLSLDDAPDVVVAGATLAVAGLFRPVRARVQAVVDRRFNRPRYDAERVLAAFSSTLRSQVHLDALAGDLRTAVERTVSPSATSLWLPDAPRGAASTP